MWRGSLYCEWINLLIPPKGCGLVLQSFSSSITSFLICALGVLGDSSKGALRVWLEWCLQNQYRHLPEKWNVFIFSPEKEMVFLAENLEVKQSCVYKIPGVLVWNWGALHQVLFCWNQNIGCNSAQQGDTVPPLIWGGRSLGASLCLVLFFLFCFAPLSFLAFPALLEIHFILLDGKVSENTPIRKDSIAQCFVSRPHKYCQCLTWDFSPNYCFWNMELAGFCFRFEQIPRLCSQCRPDCVQ